MKERGGNETGSIDNEACQDFIGKNFTRQFSLSGSICPSPIKIVSLRVDNFLPRVIKVTEQVWDCGAFVIINMLHNYGTLSCSILLCITHVWEESEIRKPIWRTMLEKEKRQTMRKPPVSIHFISIIFMICNRLINGVKRMKNKKAEAKSEWWIARQEIANMKEEKWSTWITWWSIKPFKLNSLES